jgi:hypothetical protein
MLFSVSSGFQSRDLAFVGCHVQVAASVHVEDIPAFVCEFLHQVDGAVNERQHFGVGPPVPIALGGMVAGEGEGRPFIKQDNIFDSCSAQKVSGGYTCDPRAANQGISCRFHRCTNFALSSTQLGSTRTEPSGK